MFKKYKIYYNEYVEQYYVKKMIFPFIRVDISYPGGRRRYRSDLESIIDMLAILETTLVNPTSTSRKHFAAKYTSITQTAYDQAELEKQLKLFINGRDEKYSPKELIIPELSLENEDYDKNDLTFL